MTPTAPADIAMTPMATNSATLPPLRRVGVAFAWRFLPACSAVTMLDLGPGRGRVAGGGGGSCRERACGGQAAGSLDGPASKLARRRRLRNSSRAAEPAPAVRDPGVDVLPPRLLGGFF